MKRIIYLILFLVSNRAAFSQSWIDTTYQISSVFDIAYGSSVDFKGANYMMDMDISVPTNDSPPSCGRPLMIIVHGGAWYSGDKGDGYVKRLRADFAKRGYVTASVNYRLGLFNTNRRINCNLQGWNCWNMTDTSEWYRANYRAIQDVQGAIRYLVHQKQTYNINPDNIFLVGESAGAFVVLGVGFIDDQSEILQSLVNSYPDAPAPHSLYENDCIQAFNLASSIAAMDLSRPHLGGVKGDLHFPVQDSFKIRGVGSFYGGVFNNIFESFSNNSPALYLFHQPCDLIVPYNYSKLLAGYSTCATGFPTFCQHVINRPFAYGSNAITDLIDSLVANNTPTCEYFFDNTSNTYSCLEQVTNPSLGCHAIDNYWLRTVNMATFFADKIADCAITSTVDVLLNEKTIKMYPNPASNSLNLSMPSTDIKLKLTLIDAFGKELLSKDFINTSQGSIDMTRFSQGIYQVVLEAENKVIIHSIMKR